MMIRSVNVRLLPVTSTIPGNTKRKQNWLYVLFYSCKKPLTNVSRTYNFISAILLIVDTGLLSDTSKHVFWQTVKTR